jgi:TetR/AcrR family transcriptional regulator, regulator of autoinduction and epiphytic fitness
MTGGPVAPGASTGDEFEAARIPLDRRLARGLRTRTIIIDAMIELIDAGNPHPTSPQVAARAGVAVRTVFHHFHDLEILFRSAAGLHLSRHSSLVAVIPPHGPTETRIQATCRQRRRLYEVIGPVLRATYARAQGSPGLNDVLVQHRSRLRHQLAVTLGPEIAVRGAQDRVLDTLELTTGWQSWCALRFEAGHSASSAEQFMAFTVTRMLR